jgi:hypothetical protein
VPLHAFDARAAWDGTDPAQPEHRVHVEAAAFHGKLIYFETIYPWDQPVRQEQPPESESERALIFILITIFVVAFAGSALLARKNLQSGRGDRRGAGRVALFYFTVRMLAGLFEDHHNGLPAHEFQMFLINLAFAVTFGFFLWLLYVALEPFVRRRWPERIISWSRLLAGGFRDPLVGRDILIGTVFGAGMMLITILAFVGSRWIGRPPELILNPGSTIIGAHHLVLRFTGQISAGLFNSFIPLFLLLLFVVILRRGRLAFGALWLLLTLVITLLTQVDVRMMPLTGLAALLAVLVLYRYGLLALVSAMFFFHLWVFFPITTELTAWYAFDFVIGLVICIALAVYGFYTSLAGQPLFGGRLLDE